MQTVLLHVFEQLEREQIIYCVLRGYEELETVGDKDDIDFLVQEQSLGQLQLVLKGLNFVRLPAWGYAPHHFFVMYDEASDRWLKLDVVTTVVYGTPIPSLQTALAVGCLSRRRRRGATFVPAPEDELVTLLLHCLLDKGTFAPHRLARVQELRHEIADEEYLDKLLRTVWAPNTTWAQLAAIIDNANWLALLAMRSAIVKRLSLPRRSNSSRRATARRGKDSDDEMSRRIRSTRPFSSVIAETEAGPSISLPIRRSVTSWMLPVITSILDSRPDPNGCRRRVSRPGRCGPG